MKLAALVSSVATLLAAAPAAAQSGQATHHAEYRVAFLGLPVARANFTTVFEGSEFRVAGEMSSAGVANIVGRTSGATAVSGTVGEDKLHPEHYVVTYSSGDESQKMEVLFEDGDVVSAELVPEKQRTRDDWIPTDPSDLSSVLDPVSGLMVPADAAVCDRTVEMFDGETRFDVHLTRVGEAPFSAEGFEGQAIVCNATAEPLSGYHSKRSSTEFIRQMSVEIWFARSEGAGVYAPVYARVPTKLGPVTVTATRFGS